MLDTNDLINIKVNKNKRFLINDFTITHSSNI
jgi:hypothetical protein